jgi:hypothetical protein
MSIFDRFFKVTVAKQVQLAISALDDYRDRLYSGTSQQGDRDRYDYDREDILRQSIEAWRTNPLARRIVGLTTQYVVGGGIGMDCKDKPTNRFLHAFWDHRQNHMAIRCMELCDELTRAGEIFLLISTDPAGMSYVRAIPALNISEIQTAPNDIEQELSYTEKILGSTDETIHQAYSPSPSFLPPSPLMGEGRDEGAPVMLHYSINKPVGAIRGESDLSPILKWFTRYTSWLEDRVRLNRFRFAFLYTLQMIGSTPAERARRQAELNMNPPSPGSIMVGSDQEIWTTISPNLESSDAGTDGLAIKKAICAGAGIPLHFLAEPESSTRTTAESAGGPTFRYFEQRQEYFMWMLKDLLSVVLERAKAHGVSVSTTAQINIRGADISARDNAALAVAASTIIPAFAELRKFSLIDDQEWIRMAYRFAGETVDLKDTLEAGKKAPPLPVLETVTPAEKELAANSKPNTKSLTKTDTETGDTNLKGNIE